MKRALFLGVVVVLAGWCALFFTTSGVLLHSRQHRSEGDGQDTLTCTYFTGISIVTKDFWYAEGGVFGREVCPRLQSF